MKDEKRKAGFSLTEILISIGILGVGMLFIAGVFPVALRFAATSTERSISVAVADEAFAKIQLYAEGNPDDSVVNDDINLDQLRKDEQRPGRVQDITDILPAATYDDVYKAEMTYPSFDTIVTQEQYNLMANPSADIHVLEKQQYCWSPLLRIVDDRLVQVTVFICRRTKRNARYYKPESDGLIDWSKWGTATFRPTPWPEPVKVEVQESLTNRPDELIIIEPDDDSDRITRTLINDGYTIIDDRTGRMYRVLERYAAEPAGPAGPPLDRVIKLDKDWQGSLEDAAVWVIPPPVGGGKNPCIGVFQKLIRF